jgi:hypothetical protein
MSKRTEAEIDRIIAGCDGDLHGALRALMLVNEHLESQLEELRAAIASSERPMDQSLH